MKRVCLLNGSLRGEKASSLEFLNRVSARMSAADFHIDRVTVKSGVNGRYPDETLAAVANSDAVVMAFPLFCYTLPGALTRFLEDFYFYAKEGERYNKRAKVFAIINCGFPEPWIIEEAIRVVRNFCARLGLSYRFAIAIAAGPVTLMTMKIPFLNPRLKKAFTGLAKDAGGDETVRREDIFIKPIIPKGILIKIKEHYEKKSPTLYAPTVHRTGPLSPKECEPARR
jgi:multimeric flavodoxin WrbA